MIRRAHRRHQAIGDSDVSGIFRRSESGSGGITLQNPLRAILVSDRSRRWTRWILIKQRFVNARPTTLCCFNIRPAPPVLQKGVALSHRAVLNQSPQSYSESICLKDDDVIVSWLSRFIMTWSHRRFCHADREAHPLVLMSPFDWVRAPRQIDAKPFQNIAASLSGGCPTLPTTFCAARTRRSAISVC